MKLLRKRTCISTRKKPRRLRSYWMHQSILEPSDRRVVPQTEQVPDLMKKNKTQVILIYLYNTAFHIGKPLNRRVRTIGPKLIILIPITYNYSNPLCLHKARKSHTLLQKHRKGPR